MHFWTKLDFVPHCLYWNRLRNWCLCGQYGPKMSIKILFWDWLENMWIDPLGFLWWISYNTVVPLAAITHLWAVTVVKRSLQEALSSWFIFSRGQFCQAWNNNKPTNKQVRHNTNYYIFQKWLISALYKQSNHASNRHFVCGNCSWLLSEQFCSQITVRNHFILIHIGEDGYQTATSQLIFQTQL